MVKKKFQCTPYSETCSCGVVPSRAMCVCMRHGVRWGLPAAHQPPPVVPDTATPYLHPDAPARAPTTAPRTWLRGALTSIPPWASRHAHPQARGGQPTHRWRRRAVRCEGMGQDVSYLLPLDTRRACRDTSALAKTKDPTPQSICARVSRAEQRAWTRCAPPGCGELVPHRVSSHVTAHVQATRRSSHTWQTVVGRW